MALQPAESVGNFLPARCSALPMLQGNVDDQLSPLPRRRCIGLAGLTGRPAPDKYHTRPTRAPVVAVASVHHLHKSCRSNPPRCPSRRGRTGGRARESQRPPLARRLRLWLTKAVMTRLTVTAPVLLMLASTCWTAEWTMRRAGGELSEGGARGLARPMARGVGRSW